MENEHVCQTFAYFHVDGIVEKKEISVFFSIQPPKIMLCRRHLKTKKGESKHFVRPFSYEIYYHTNYIVKLIRNLNKRMYMYIHVYVYKYIFKQRLVMLQKHENSGKNLINTFLEEECSSSENNSTISKIKVLNVKYYLTVGLHQFRKF